MTKRKGKCVLTIKKKFKTKTPKDCNIHISDNELEKETENEADNYSNNINQIKKEKGGEKLVKNTKHESNKNDMMNEDKKSKITNKDIGQNNELTKNEDFIGFCLSSSEEKHSNLESESEDEISTNRYKEIKGEKKYPWIKSDFCYEQEEIADWLTHEIIEFVGFISPSPEEISVRNKVVNKLKAEIQNLWIDAKAYVFGSYATNLYLPGSDIDIVVVSESGNYAQKSKLYQFSAHLRTKKIAKNIKVISKAKVPIVKFVDNESKINIDVSFEKRNGIQAANKIKKWMSTTLGLRELVIIVKYFLRTRKLNNVHVGGLGGYATIILCYHFLRLHPKISTNSIFADKNLGVLLIEFFELYGRNFSYDNLIIALDPKSDEPIYLHKKNCPALDVMKNSFSIIIQDPSEPVNNITRSSYSLRDFKKAFCGAYQLLINKCYKVSKLSYKERLGELILGSIISYTQKERNINDDRYKIANSQMLGDDSINIRSDNDSVYYCSDLINENDDKNINVADNKKRSFVESFDSEKTITDFLGIKNDYDYDSFN